MRHYQDNFLIKDGLNITEDEVLFLMQSGLIRFSIERQ